MGFLIFLIIYGIICLCQIRERNATADYWNREAQKRYAVGDYENGDRCTEAAIRAKRS